MQNNENPVVALLRAPAGLSILAQLTEIDPFSLSRPDRVDYLAALEKQTAWLQALLNKAICAAAHPQMTSIESIYDGVEEPEREEVATALRMSVGTAQMKIDLARTMTEKLPLVCQALALGEISPSHANIIARESEMAIREGLNPEALKELQSKAIAYAEYHTPAQVASKVRQTIAKLAPETFEGTVEAARQMRKVSIYKESDGMATLVAILPAPDAQTVMLAIDKLARKKRNALPDEHSRPERELLMDQLRADALTEIMSNFLATTEDDGHAHRRPITLNLTLDLPTLLGLASNPGELVGYGAIPASLARELAADAKWRRFITDPISGNLLDFGREQYEPPQVLVDFLMARDRTCRFPGCRQPSHVADIDHAESWESGGKTSPENLGLLCRRHHRLKTHGGWTLESFADGSCQWTSPLGKKYLVPARPIHESV